MLPASGAFALTAGVMAKENAAHDYFMSGVSVNCWDWPVCRILCAAFLEARTGQNDERTKTLTNSDYQSRGQAAATSLCLELILFTITSFPVLRKS